MPPSRTKEFQIAVFLENPQDIETIQQALNALNIKNSDVHKGGVKEAISLFLHQKSPKYLIIDISKSDMPVSDLSQLGDLCDPEVSVIAVGAKNDVGLYRDLMKLGIFDYLVSPLFSDILARSLKLFLFGEEDSKKSHAKFGKIVVFVGARGGVGTTLLATNFSTLVSTEKARRVILLDLDFHLGTASLYLDLKPNNGLRDILENPDRIDPLFIERLLIPVNDRLSIVSSEEDLKEKILLKNESIEIFLESLSKHSHYVVVDTPHYSNGITEKTIAHAHIMVLVTDPSLASLRDAGRFLRLFGAEEGGRKVVIVMNKLGLYDKGEVKVADFEQTLAHKVNHVLLFDKSNPLDFINRGKMLVEEKSALSSSIKNLVDDVIGSVASEVKTNWFLDFFKRN